MVAEFFTRLLVESLVQNRATSRRDVRRLVTVVVRTYNDLRQLSFVLISLKFEHKLVFDLYRRLATQRKIVGEYLLACFNIVQRTFLLQ